MSYAAVITDGYSATTSRVGVVTGYFIGKVEEISFPGYEKLLERCFREVSAFLQKGEDSKKVTTHTDGFEGFRKRSREAKGWIRESFWSRSRF